MPLLEGEPSERALETRRIPRGPPPLPPLDDDLAAAPFPLATEEEDVDDEMSDAAVTAICDGGFADPAGAVDGLDEATSSAAN